MGPQDPATLKEAVAYETYFLQEVFRVIEQPLTGKYERVWAYSIGASKPKVLNNYLYADGVQHWRTGFLVVGGPLILVTAFKVLDMIVEWIVGPPLKGQWQFKDKLETLNNASNALPGLLGVHPWLARRFGLLYETLFPLRNTLIHADRFNATNGGLEAASSLGRGKYAATRTAVGPDEIQAVAAAAVILAKCLDDSWAPSLYLELQLKWRLDQLAPLHGEGAFGAKRPMLSLVRIVRNETPFIEFDAQQIFEDLNAPWMSETPSGQSVDMKRYASVFDLEIGIRRSEEPLNVYRVPMAKLAGFPKGIAMEQLLPFQVAAPAEIEAFIDGR